jgi:hypothetical protein
MEALMRSSRLALVALLAVLMASGGGDKSLNRPKCSLHDEHLGPNDEHLGNLGSADIGPDRRRPRRNRVTGELLRLFVRKPKISGWATSVLDAPDFYTLRGT